MFKLISRIKADSAGKPVSLQIRYVHEDKSLSRGASLRIGYNFNDGAGQCQTESPQKPNYLTVVKGFSGQLNLKGRRGFR